MTLSSPSRPPAPPEERLGFAALKADDGKEIKLAMQELFLAGRILVVGARLVVRHTFVSSEAGPAEMVYSFALPRDAALRRFNITGDGFTARSELKPAGEARKLYEDGLENGHLSTLAQQYRDGYVNLNVGHVRPGEKVTVFLEILAGVDLRDDGLRFRFPFTLAPCYHAGMKAGRVDDNTGELELPEKDFGDLILPPFARDASSLHRIGFDLAVQMPGPIAEAGSPSHAIKVRTTDPQRLRIGLAPERDVPNRDLVLDVRMQAPFSGVLCGAGKDNRTHFAAVVSSDRFGKAGNAPRRLVFVFDRSGSMEGEPIRQARNAVLACLGALSAADQIGFIAFDSAIESFKDALADTDTRTREELRNFIEQVEARGGTELFQGLNAASKLLGRAGGDLFVLTDGQVSATEDIIQSANALGIRIHCLGISSASQDRFLAQLARNTGGISRFVTPRERVDQAALELFAAIGRPVAADIRVAAQGLGDASLAPEPAGRVFSGHPLLIYGESAPGDGQLVIDWSRDGTRQSFSLPVQPGAGADAETLRLLRGTRLIADLESQLGAGPEPGAAAKRESTRIERLLVELGQIYGLANRQLALVAVVERAGDKAGQLPKTSIVPVGMPQDTEFKAYFGRIDQAPDSAARYVVHESCARPALKSNVSAYDMGLRFSLGNRSPQSDITDLCVDLARRIEPDGGLPGKTAEERVCHSLVALLTLSEPDRAGAFHPHCTRLIAFLESGVCSVLNRERQELVRNVLSKVRACQPVAGPWHDLAEMLILKGRAKLPAVWKHLGRAILSS